ncbi:hypothetical protein [Simkania sp.]|uniref:hypothetical protein n=1 Tax=Simkania sp. TaxID=34094 RepID=UPI003B520A80
MEIVLGTAGFGSISLAVSYGFQRGVSLLTGNSDGYFLGTAAVYTTTQIGSMYLSARLIEPGSDYVRMKLIIVQTVVIAGLFFSSIGYHLLTMRSVPLDLAVRVGGAVIFAAGKAGQYIADTVAKIGLLIAFGHFGAPLLEYATSAANARWAQLKSNFAVLQTHLTRRYEYYTFPTYTSREQFKELSKEQLEAVRVHYSLYPDKWEAFALSLQVAFNLILTDEDLPLLPLTSPLKEEDDFTKKELKFIAKEYYRNYRLSAEEATVFFHHHVKPPEYLVEKESLPQVPIPKASDIPSLSKAQIKWFHKILIADWKTKLTSEQYSAFAKRFFEYNLIPPNEKYVFDVELPPPTTGIHLHTKAYYYFLYVKEGRDEKLPFDERLQLREYLIERNFSCSFPTLTPVELTLASEPILSAVAKQFRENRFLWEQLDTEAQESYNAAFKRCNIEEVRDGRRFASLRDGLSSILGNSFGMRHYSNRSLMDVEAEEQRNLGYLAEIPAERVNYLHPSMISHLPDAKIVFVERADLVQAIPKDKLFFIHPKIYPLLSNEQMKWMKKLHKGVADLSLEQTRLLLCPWLVRHVPEDRLSEVPKQGKEFVLCPTKISPFHQAFFSLLQTPTKAWDEMTLIEQTLFDLVPFGQNRFPMIESIQNLYSEFRNLARDFGIRELPSDYALRILTNTANLRFFADDPEEAEIERQKMHYEFKHLIYALKIMADKNPPLDQETKATVGILLKQLFRAMDDCKNAWSSGLESFEGKRNEFCDCPDCSGMRMNDQEVFLKSRLAVKLALFKRECFQKVIIKAYGAGDGQQVHTLDWYARELPHLNLHSGYSDRHAGISRTSVAPLEMQNRMIEEYKQTVKSYVKDLLSYGEKGNQEFRELAMDFTAGIILREAKKRKAYIDSSWAKEVAQSWIFDEEKEYEVREGFVNIILYAFDHFGFDPLSEVFTQAQTNGCSLSQNLDLVSIKLTQLDKA